MNKYVTLLYWICWCITHPKQYKRNEWTPVGLYQAWKIYFNIRRK